MWKSLLNLNLKFGSKEARQSILVYDDATKRIPDADLARLKKTFRKDAISDYLPKHVFVHHVMGDSVPLPLAEAVFAAFGGSNRGIGFKDLLAGMVLVCYGTQDEKIQFLFHLFSGGANSMPLGDLLTMIKTSEGGHIPEHVVHAFSTTENITADQFRSWISIYWGTMALTRWLLENDFKPALISEPGRDEIPTFYQTLAGVTHLDEKEIFDLEKFYGSLKGLSTNGRFDVSLFAMLVSPPLPSVIVANLYQAFDENCDGHIDLKELVCGVSACSRGPSTERLKFCFKVFDFRRKKHLTQEELICMLRVFIGVDDVQSAGYTSDDDEEALARMAHDVLEHYSEDGVFTLDNFLLWSTQTNMPAKFMRILFQICHVVLGLKPLHKEDEFSSIIEWLQRDARRVKLVGDVYYVLSSEWWRSWRRYVDDSPMDVITDGEIATVGRKRSNGLNLSEIIKLPSRSASRVSTPTLSRSSSTMSVQSRYPGPINNQSILVPENHNRLKSLTEEGGILRRRSDGTRLRDGDDFMLVCEAVWKVFSHWYSGGPDVPRQCILMENGHVEPDVFPVCVRLLKHRITEMDRPLGAYPYGGMVSGFNAMQSSQLAIGAGRTIVERTVFAAACFHRSTKLEEIHECLRHKLRIPSDNMRLWIYVDDNNMTLIEDESVTLGISLKDSDQLLVEIRNKDLTWPEEMQSITRFSNRKPLVSRSGSISRDDGSYEKGCCGLNNLGNTCFLNSALQCVSYSRPLTFYFRTKRYGQELNRVNPIGYGGLVAERYADLIGQMWSGRFRCVAPLKIRQLVCKHKQQFGGYGQHDSHELLAFLLDGLHEDLNRVHEKPYVELNDSKDRDDEIVAQEAWENHLRRNQSIVVDLFHGLLKSRVKCLTCQKASIRFDPFSVLSLPLPLDNFIFLELSLIRCDGGGPVKFGLRIDPEATFGQLREAFSRVCGLSTDSLLPVEVSQGLVKRFFAVSDRLQNITLEGRLWMYEIPLVPDLELDSAIKDQPRPKWIMAFHRRMVHNDNYYLAWAKATPKIFGVPVIISCDDETTNRQLYERVWIQIKRFIGPESGFSEESNHAQECDALNSVYCFVLKTVREDGCWCSLCPWYRFCRGCPLILSEEMFGAASERVVIDWEPTFYHLRYQDSLEYIVREHESCRTAKLEHTEPISLDSCFKDFTNEERLDGLYKCSNCQQECPASKRMQLYQAPPMLAVHFKRFLKVRDQWVKSHKVVTFPFNDLDLSSYLAAPDAPMTPVTPAESEESMPAPAAVLTNGYHHYDDGDHLEDSTDSDDTTSVDRKILHNSGMENSATSTTPSISNESVNGTRRARSDSQNLKYDLYAICCHSGLIATGHYVAYCKNPNGKWYLFNDSSCKEIPESQIDSSTAYMLFYERRGLDYDSYLPEVMDISTSADAAVGTGDSTSKDSASADSKNFCTLQ